MHVGWGQRLHEVAARQPPPALASAPTSATSGLVGWLGRPATTMHTHPPGRTGRSVDVRRGSAWSTSLQITQNVKRTAADSSRHARQQPSREAGTAPLTYTPVA